MAPTSSLPYHKAADFRIGETWLRFDRVRRAAGRRSPIHRLASEYRIELGPAIGPHLTFEKRAYFVFSPGLEHNAHAILRSGANAAADVIPTDHQIAHVVRLAADQNVRMRIVVIVMGPEIRHFASVIGAHDEPKMMSVIPATLANARSRTWSISRVNMRAVSPVRVTPSRLP